MKDARRIASRWIVALVAMIALIGCQGGPTDKARLISAGLHMEKSELNQATELVNVVLENDPDNAEATS